MDQTTQLVELENLKNQGMLTEEEFQAQKDAVQSNNADSYEPKSQTVYVVLAFFFGLLGVHNFYIGRWKRGLAQLFLTLFTLFIGSIITYLWVIINIFAMKTDGQGRLMKPSTVAKIICGILTIFGMLWWLVVLGVMVIFGVAGYQSRMAEYHAEEWGQYARMVQNLAAAKRIIEPVSCDSLLPGAAELGGNCLVAGDGTVVVSGLDTVMADRIAQVTNGLKIKMDTVIIPAMYLPQ